MDVRNGVIRPESSDEHYICRIAHGLSDSSYDEGRRVSDINKLGLIARASTKEARTYEGTEAYFMISGLKYLIKTEDGILSRTALKALTDIAQGSIQELATQPIAVEQV
jgi:hypothetical protein